MHDPDEAMAVAQVLAERAPTVTSVLVDADEAATVLAALYSLSEYDTDYLAHKFERALKRLEERKAT